MNSLTLFDAGGGVSLYPPNMTLKIAHKHTPNFSCFNMTYQNKKKFLNDFQCLEGGGVVWCLETPCHK